MKRYTLSFGRSIGYRHASPDRTARKILPGIDGDIVYQVWPNRPAMARSIRMQQSRAPHNQDWHALEPLTDAEGF
ncbi:hypothetical protein LCGC14_1894000 [marine sediment metagenome]|uniref:Uncharacterized protein n=1 Tax=marine sediment metagenome TaxID=412755 RepID=A0A0F9ICG4_9ZZZZ